MLEDIEKIKLENNFYDFIYSFRTFMYLENKLQVLSNLYLKYQK